MRAAPARGFRLVSYAVGWIRAAIRAFVMRSWSMVKLGTTLDQRKLFFHLRAACQRAENESATILTGEAALLARQPA